MIIWVPHLLSQIGAPRLATLEFDIWLFDARQLRNPQWNEIAWILSHPRFFSVREFKFVHRGSMDTQAESAVLRGRLNALEARHVLTIKHEPIPLCM